MCAEVGKMLVQLLEISNLTLRGPRLPPLTASTARLVFEGPLLQLEPLALAVPGGRPLTLSASVDWTTPVRGPRPDSKGKSNSRR